MRTGEARREARTRTAQHICMYGRGSIRADIRMMREATALAQAGYEVTVIDLEPDATRPVREDVDGVHLWHLIQPNRFRRTRFKPWFVVKAWRTSRLAAKTMARVPADAYHARDIEGLFAAAGIARKRRRPLVFDAYEVPLVQTSLTRWRLFHALAVRRLRRTMPRVTEVVVASSRYTAVLQYLYGGPIAAAVRNIPPYQPPVVGSNRIREALGLPAETRIALYQGAFQENRSLHLLVNAGPYLAPNHVIVLMGFGPTEASLRRLIDERGLGDRVKMLPAAPYAELLSWTASADLGLSIFDPDHSLSIKYCQPNKLFEYLMAGVPVLASDLPGVVEVLRRYRVGGMVASLDGPDIAHAINAILSDDAALAGMKRNALAAARTDLNWEVEQRELIDLYKRIFQQQPANSAPPVMARQV